MLRLILLVCVVVFLIQACSKEGFHFTLDGKTTTIKF